MCSQKFIPQSSSRFSPKVTLCTSLEKTLVEKLDSLAKENKITRSELIRQCIRYAIANLPLDSAEKNQ